MNREITLNIISFLLALMFCYAGVSKLLDLQKFGVQLSQSPMLTPIAKPLSVVLPVVEVIISVAIFFSILRLICLYLCLLLMTIFTSYVIVIMTYSVYVPCSCGGILDKLGWGEHLIFNGAFLVMTVVAIVMVERDKVDSITTQQCSEI